MRSGKCSALALPTSLLGRWSPSSSDGDDSRPAAVGFLNGRGRRRRLRRLWRRPLLFLSCDHSGDGRRLVDGRVRRRDVGHGYFLQSGVRSEISAMRMHGGRRRRRRRRYARMNGGEKSLDNGNVPGDPDTDWNIVRKGIDVQGY